MANEYLPADMATWMATAARNATEGLGSSRSRSVTYTQVTARTYTPTSGARSETSGSGSFTMHRLRLDGKEGDGRQEAGEFAYLCEITRLTDEFGASYTPNRRDRITDGSDVFEVLSWESDGLRYHFQVRRVGT